jgi:DNA-binding NtrC family response regulator
MKARILIVDDESPFRDLYSRTLAEAGFQTTTAESTEDALARIEADPPDLVVSDVRMPGASGIDLLRIVRTRTPGMPFLLVTAFADVREAVEALKLGAVDYLAKPVDLDELVACVHDSLGLTPVVDAIDLPPGALGDMIAASPVMRSLLRDAWRIAQSDATVLLTGESGTGKEELAQFVHRNSPRAQGPMVAINCAAIPATLLAAELFGHEKGAFTGATSRREGHFREAHRGTLFLDEIGDVPLELQPVLLRAIERRRITPVGGRTEIAVDMRLVTATNRHLEDDIVAGRFRSDLYHRLNVIALEIPPLRERPEDIVPLARHFLAHSGQGDKRLSRAAVQVLLAYPWPGNVRELSNAMERARLLSRTDVILPEHLPPVIRAAWQGTAPMESDGADPEDGDVPAPGPGVMTLEHAEIDSIRRALAQTGGNRTKSAELLGITRRGLINKLKRFHL